MSIWILSIAGTLLKFHEKKIINQYSVKYEINLIWLDETVSTNS